MEYGEPTPNLFVTDGELELPILYNLAVNWDSSIKGFNFTFTNHPLDMRTPIFTVFF